MFMSEVVSWKIKICIVAAMEGAGIEVPEGCLLAISMKRRRQDEEGQDGGEAE
jgi:hypothetical protein